MNYLLRLQCWWSGHDWRNDTEYPVHGFRNVPWPESYCDRCELTGAEYLGIKKKIVK